VPEVNFAWSAIRKSGARFSARIARPAKESRAAKVPGWLRLHWNRSNCTTRGEFRIRGT